MIVLSHYQAKPLLESRGRLSSLKVSPDLGLSQVVVHLGDAIRFPGEVPLSWDVLNEIAGNENKCYRIDHGRATSIQEFSEVFNRIYTLYPTETAPTMLISGIPMHRIKATDPWTDSKTKIKAFGRVSGMVLDTATGLGYTAILAADHADQVVTVELDPTAQAVARLNPWSQNLFDHPKIQQRIGNSAELIETFGSGLFSGIIHDPPMFSMAGELYALEFYQQAYRVLKPNGRMFHYIGNPESKSGKRVTAGVIQRLKEAGFSRVVPSPRAFGVMAYKYRKMA